MWNIQFYFAFRANIHMQCFIKIIYKKSPTYKFYGCIVNSDIWNQFFRGAKYYIGSYKSQFVQMVKIPTDDGFDLNKGPERLKIKKPFQNTLYFEMASNEIPLYRCIYKNRKYINLYHLPRAIFHLI